MISGYNSYQLTFGQTQNLSSVLVDKLPALEGSTISEWFYQHLNALHSAHQTFFQAESSEWIRVALDHQIHAFSQIFETSDRV